MSKLPLKSVSVPVLKCMYCGNEWVPRTARMPKVCPRCKRYGWETGTATKRKGGKNVSIGPGTRKFVRQQKKEK